MVRLVLRLLPLGDDISDDGIIVHIAISATGETTPQFVRVNSCPIIDTIDFVHNFFQVLSLLLRW
jgi:hypothetical protein